MSCYSAKMFNRCRLKIFSSVCCRHLSTKVTQSPKWLKYWLPTEQNLNKLEQNIILRKHKNNVPQIRALLKELEQQPDDENLHIQLQFELEKVPNNTHERLLDYGEEPRELMRIDALNKVDKAQEFSDVCKRLNLLRMEHLGNYSGHKSYYLMGALASMEQALIHYATSVLKEDKFEFISVPDILPKDIIEGCGMNTEGERTQVYKLNMGMCLSGTSEMALAGFFANQMLDEKDLPIKVAAVSRCFRAETSATHEERGIYRVHQFTKVEMFAICTKEQSEDMLESFKDTEIQIYQKLGLSFRLLDMPASELGLPAYQKYDIEAWMPGKHMWGEISSCSNCTDYQAKRLNIQYHTNDKKIRYAHTVNGTAAAIPRLLLAIVESNQVANDTISIPSVLRRYMQQNKIKKEKQIPELKLVKSIKAIT